MSHCKDLLRFPLRAAAAVALALAAGCAAGPDYVRPAASLPADYVQGQALRQRQGERPAPPLDAWWQGFDDPELVRIVERALHQNLDLAAALARAGQARAAAREAGAERLPQGSLDGQGVYQRQSLTSPLGLAGSLLPAYRREQSYEDLGVGASWELDLAGGLRRNAQAATAEAEAAEASQAGVRVSLAAEAADAYFRARGAQQRIALAEEQVRTEENLLSLVRLRLAGGLATRREQAQAEALVQQARASVPPLRIELAAQLNRLDVLMGAAPGTYAQEIRQTSHDYRVPAIAAQATPAELLRRRPDVIAAERRLAAADARIGVALAEYYPKLSLSGLLGFATLQPGGPLFASAAFQPQAALGLHWRLFDFGRVDAEVAQARGAEAEALARYRQSMLSAAEDVENAVVSLTELEVQHAELAREVAAHQVARAAAEEAYRGGAVSLYEVLDEDRQLLASRDALARVRADDARAAVATFRALGGGWEASGNDASQGAGRPAAAAGKSGRFALNN